MTTMQWILSIGIILLMVVWISPWLKWFWVMKTQRRARCCQRIVFSWRTTYMPYIKDQRRQALDITGLTPNNSGELNYAITSILLDYLDHRGVKYATFNDIIGALESAKLEFYRREITPYEDKKIADNGDVY